VDYLLSERPSEAVATCRNTERDRSRSSRVWKVLCSIPESAKGVNCVVRVANEQNAPHLSTMECCPLFCRRTSSRTEERKFHIWAVDCVVVSLKFPHKLPPPKKRCQDDTRTQEECRWDLREDAKLEFRAGWPASNVALASGCFSKRFLRLHAVSTAAWRD
jgi:hypothetical protein